MVLYFDSKMFLATLPGKSLRQRPRFQDAFHFQAEVVMQPARSMLLNDESRGAFDLFWNRFAGWLVGAAVILFFLVLFKLRCATTYPLITARRRSFLVRWSQRLFYKIGRSLRRPPQPRLALARQRFADEVSDEATNDDVFPKFRNLGVQQVANRHIGIFDEALLEQ